MFRHFLLPLFCFFLRPKKCILLYRLPGSQYIMFHICSRIQNYGPVRKLLFAPHFGGLRGSINSVTVPRILNSLFCGAEDQLTPGPHILPQIGCGAEDQLVPGPRILPQMVCGAEDQLIPGPHILPQMGCFWFILRWISA